MILVADSGSTKTSWVLAGNDGISMRIGTAGINPAVQNIDDIVVTMTDIASALPETPREIHFYGAGCRGEARSSMLRLLHSVFEGEPQLEKIEVESDLLGAARALFGDEEGIACILGTGSNSCLYDGNNIVENIPPLGYILGDEGSGAAIGKAFINALFKGRLPGWLQNEYFAETGQSYDIIIHRVYRRQCANRFLASISKFIAKHMEVNELTDIVEYNFEQFFDKNVCRYSRCDLPVAAVGSIAYVYQEIFMNVASAKGLHVSKILKEPIDAIVDYHLRHR